MTKDTCRVGEAKRRRTQGRRERAKVLMTRMKGGDGGMEGGTAESNSSVFAENW